VQNFQHPLEKYQLQILDLEQCTLCAHLMTLHQDGREPFAQLSFKLTGRFTMHSKCINDDACADKHA
jgi:hypothetical protein